tara:strand:+ start:3402 stop:4124 length:723 start_codon:yes stop_codon:yes gene_type:complete
MKGHTLKGPKQRKAAPLPGLNMGMDAKATNVAEKGLASSSPMQMMEESPMKMGHKKSPAKDIKSTYNKAKKYVKKTADKVKKSSFVRGAKEVGEGFKTIGRTIANPVDSFKADLKHYRKMKASAKKKKSPAKLGAMAGAAGAAMKKGAKSAAKMGMKKSPAKKPLVGKQKNLPEGLKSKILASPAKMGEKSVKTSPGADRKAINKKILEKSINKIRVNRKIRKAKMQRKTRRGKMQGLTL